VRWWYCCGGGTFIRSCVLLPTEIIYRSVLFNQTGTGPCVLIVTRCRCALLLFFGCQSWMWRASDILFVACFSFPSFLLLRMWPLCRFSSFFLPARPPCRTPRVTARARATCSRRTTRPMASSLLAVTSRSTRLVSTPSRICFGMCAHGSWVVDIDCFGFLWWHSDR